MNSKPPSKMTHDELDGLNVPRQTYGKTWTLIERRSYARYNPPKPKGSRMWKSEQGLCPSCQSPLDGTDLSCVNSGCSQYGTYAENDGSPDEIANGEPVWN